MKPGNKNSPFVIAKIQPTQLYNNEMGRIPVTEQSLHRTCNYKQPATSGIECMHVIYLGKSLLKRVNASRTNNNPEIQKIRRMYQTQDPQTFRQPHATIVALSLLPLPFKEVVEELLSVFVANDGF